MYPQHHALALGAGLLLSASVQAAVGVTADAGTTGAGAHLVAPFAPSLNGRAGLNYLKHDFERKSGALDYDLHGKLQSIDFLLDWYPRAPTAFRLSAGLVYNGSRFDARGKPRQNAYLINGQQYDAAQAGVLSGKINFRKVAPYIGIGWGNALAQERRWNVGADIGAFYQGKPDVTLANAGCSAGTAVCDAIAGEVAAEQARLQADAASFRFYPVLRLSLGYRF